MGWITTYTNKKFYPLSPKPQDVCLEDIVWALSFKCRWTGHSRVFYSVAEHSVRVAEEVLRQVQAMSVEEHVPYQAALIGLMHDATEAYLPDVARPIKESILIDLGEEVVSFREAEDRLMKVISTALELPSLSSELYPQIKRADDVVLITEARDIVHGLDSWAKVEYEPLEEVIVPWTPEKSRVEFMKLYNKLILLSFPIGV